MESSEASQNRPNSLSGLVVEHSYAFNVLTFVFVAFLLSSLQTASIKVLTLLAVCAMFALMCRTFCLVQLGDALQFRRQVHEWLFELGVVFYVAAIQSLDPVLSAVYVLVGLVFHHVLCLLVFRQVVR